MAEDKVTTHKAWLPMRKAYQALTQSLTHYLDHGLAHLWGRLSGKGSDQVAGVGREVRSEPRFRVLPLHRISFEARLGLDLSDPSKLSKIPVVNLSTQGIGLLFDRGPVPSKKRFDCKITIDDREFVTQIEVRHQTQSTLGCSFVDPASSSANLNQVIHQYLQVEMQGIRLVKIDETRLAADARGETHWYNDGSHNEIYFITNLGHVVYFHLTCLGLYIEGGEREHIRTGRVSIKPVNQGIRGYTSANLVDSDPNVSHESLLLGMRLIESAQTIPDQARIEMLSILNTALAS